MRYRPRTSPAAAPGTTSTSGAPLLTALLAAALAAASAGLVPPTPAVATTRARRMIPGCSPADLVAEAELVRAGNPVTALAGAVLLHNVTRRACTLQGAPRVTVSATGGGPLPVDEWRTPGGRPAVLGPGSASRPGTAVGVSVTWSDWSCAPGSFSLDLRFPGWPRAVSAPYGTTEGYAGPPCTSSGSQTVYVGPAGRTGR